MTTATILPPARTVFVNSNGTPLVGGKVFFYVPPATSTPKTTWQDAGETIPNSNPVILDTNGSALIYGSGQYYMVVQDSANNLIWNGLTNSSAIVSAAMAPVVSATTLLAGRNAFGLYQVNVKQFGAIGDGVTDDFGAFVSAVASLPSNGGTIYVTGGVNNTYLWKLQSGASPSLKLPSNCAIIMDPDVYILNQGLATGVNGYASACFTNANQTSGNKNIWIVGGKIKAATGYSGTVCIAMRKVTNLYVDGVQGLDITGSCHFQTSFCTNVWWNDIYIGWEGAFPMSFSFTDGIRVGSGSSNVNISNCILNSGDNAIAINNEPAEANGGTGANINAVNISNCIVTTQSTQALLIYNEATMSTGNIFDINIENLQVPAVTSSSDVITIEDNNNRAAIQNVFFNSCYLNAASASGNGVTLLNCNGINFDNIILTTFNTYGFDIANTPGVVLTNCQIAFPRGGGDSVLIGSGSTNCQIIGCVILNNAGGRDNIRIDGGNDVLLLGNTLTGATGYGINLGPSNALTGARIIGNKISNTNSGGIIENSGTDYVECALNDVHSCTTPIVITSSGSHSQYTNNIGFNPSSSAAATITVGASPFTYTAGPTPEAIYITGGTVSVIAINGTTVFSATPATIYLGPHSAVVVTYSGAPTMHKALQ